MKSSLNYRFGLPSPFYDNETSFSPASLFSASDVGTWFDPSHVAYVLSSGENIATYSQQLEVSTYVYTNVGVSVNVGVAPDGTLSAERMTPTAVAGNHFIDVASSTGLVTISIFVKPDGLRYFTLGNLADANYGACFDLQTGNLAIPAGVGVISSGIVPVGNGWYRCYITVCTSNLRTAFAFPDAPSNTYTSYTGDGVSGAYLWGVQFNYGGEMTPYTPTTFFSRTQAKRFQEATAIQLFNVVSPVAGEGALGAGIGATGLLLDKSKGYGPNLLLNGDFSNGTTGWVDQGGVNASTMSVSDGTATVTNTGATFGAQRSTGFPTVVGQWYRVRLKMARGTVTQCSFYVTGSTLLTPVLATQPSVSSMLPGDIFTSLFRATTTTTYLYLGGVSNTTNGTHYYSNITVSERYGNTAVQTVTAARPFIGSRPVTGKRNLLIASSRFTISWSVSGTIAYLGFPALFNNSEFTTLLGETATTGSHEVYQVYTAVGAEYTYSVYAKAGVRRRFALRESTTSLNGAIFDLVSGTVVSNLASGVGSIEPVEDGWFRCSVVSTETAGTRRFTLSMLLDDATSVASYTGVVTLPVPTGISFFGPQLELGATPTDFQLVGFTSDRSYERGVQTVFYLIDDLVDDSINWTAPAGDYTIAYVDRDGVVTILTSQALSGTTDVLRDERYVAGYLAINRDLTALEITNLTSWFKIKAPGAP